MKRVAIVTVGALCLAGLALAANVFKFTFSDETYPDGRTGTIRASTKITKKSTFTVCGYFGDPNDQFLGEFQDDAFASADAAEVEQFCLDHFDERQPMN